MSRTRHSTRKTLGIVSAAIVAASTIAAITVSSAAPTQSNDRYGFPLRPLADERSAEAATRLEQGNATFDEASYGVDPVVTGPVSATFKRRRAVAGCDKAEWPTVPKVCYPD